LRAKLERTAARESIEAIFHAAALSDFRVKQISGADGANVSGEKLCSGGGELTLTLAPAPKLIDDLRSLFPAAFLVGWKYELDGTSEDAIKKGLHQIARAKTDVCVVNGKAYGAGFGVLEPRKAPVHCETKQRLCADLVTRCLVRAHNAPVA